jgi:hypothetical protein
MPGSSESLKTIDFPVDQFLSMLRFDKRDEQAEVLSHGLVKEPFR